MPASVCSRRRSSGTISSTVSSTSAEYAAPAADCWGWPGAPGASWLAWLPWPARPPRSRTWPLTSTTASSATTPPNCCSWLANRVTGRLPSRSSSTNRPMKRPAFGPLLIFTRVNPLTPPPPVTVPSAPPPPRPARAAPEQVALALLALAALPLAVLEHVVEHAGERRAVHPQAVEGAGLDQALEHLVGGEPQVDLAHQVGQAAEAPHPPARPAHGLDRPLPDSLDGA